MRNRVLPLVLGVIVVLGAVFFLREPVSCYFYLRGSPTGMIAFVRNGSIYVMDRDGGNQCRVADGDFRFPTWSPDGSRLAFVERDEDELYVVNADGSELRKLGEDLNLSIAAPSWSADSTQIAYPASNTINIVDVASGETHTISDDLGVLTLAVSWSPDGTQFAFVASGEDPVSEELWVVNADGSNPHWLEVTVSDNIRTPYWLSDSQRVVFNSARFELTVVNTQDGSIEVLTSLQDDGVGGIWGFAVSPTEDRAAILVLMRGNDNTNTFVVDMATGELQQVTDGTFADWDVAWQDGEHLLLGREDAAVERDTRFIYSLNLNDGELHQLTQGRSPTLQP